MSSIFDYLTYKTTMLHSENTPFKLSLNTQFQNMDNIFLKVTDPFRQTIKEEAINTAKLHTYHLKARSDITGEYGKVKCVFLLTR